MHPPLSAVLGPKGPPARGESADFLDAIARREGRLLVVNDEAHHTHDEGSKWTEAIKRPQPATPIASQLDFSATPRFQKGALFPWIISDYPLNPPIIDDTVTRLYKVIAS